MQLCVQLVWLHRVHSGKSLNSLKTITGGTSSLQAPVLSLPSVPILFALSILGEGVSQSPAGPEAFCFFPVDC